ANIIPGRVFEMTGGSPLSVGLIGFRNVYCQRPGIEQFAFVIENEDAIDVPGQDALCEGSGSAIRSGKGFQGGPGVLPIPCETRAGKRKLGAIDIPQLLANREALV